MLIKLNIVFSINLIFDLNLELIFNEINLIFSSVVISISIMVLIYRKIYFSFKINNSYYLNLIIFIISMIFIIFRNNVIIIIIGWDGLGISSFYLVSFYSNYDRSISRLITFFFNRLGDCFILVFCCLVIFLYSRNLLFNFNFLILLILFIGLITKRSQIPFGVWLPIAMSAPTPISSLVHSSTLVTAGIYVIIKIKFIFFINEIQFLLIIFRLLTFIFGGFFSFSILDIKKAIAFSTLSQLGFILFRIRLGNLSISFYHLLFHAFFKSSLFINMGFFILFNFSSQDQRIIKNNNFNYLFKICFFISCINLIGLISTLGFLSKDLILIFFLNFNIKINLFLIVYLGCIFTVLYSLKFILIVLNKNLIYFPFCFKIIFNFFFIGFLLFSFFIIIFSLNFYEILFFYTSNFLSKIYKNLFYFIIIFSMLVFKILFNNINFFLINFSSIIIILENWNLLLIKNFKILINFSFKLLTKEEYFQLNLILIFLSNSSNFISIKFIFRNILIFILFLIINLIIFI